MNMNYWEKGGGKAMSELSAEEYIQDNALRDDVWFKDIPAPAL